MFTLSPGNPDGMGTDIVLIKLGFLQMHLKADVFA